MDFIGLLIVIGFVLVAIYLLLTQLREKTTPDLTEAVTILISATGLSSAFQLGYIAIFEASLFTGKLQDQRIPIVVGAFAILWVSLQAIFQIYRKHYYNRQPNLARQT